MVEFGELKKVSLRQAWPHEANDFTPWLADNLDKLTQVIGIPMELVATEMSVEQFSADIVARYPANGSLILIENQLEWTDHTHLGQVLTYLAGTEAQTVIWIAREFTNPHLSAIRWLNEHTVAPYAFFAVRVSVVQISNSPLAPIFEVLERPSDWDRKVHVEQEIIESGGHAKFRNDFWMFYTQRHPGDLQLSPGYKGSNVFPKISGLTLSMYLAQNGVGIYIRPDNAEARQLAERCGPVLEEKGLIQDWHSSRFQHIDSQNRENWPEMTDWLHDKFVAYREVIESVAATPVEPEPDEIALDAQS